MMRFINSFFTKKKKSRWVNLIPGVETCYPITPAAKFKPAWLSRAAEVWKKQQQYANIESPYAGGNIIRCPGLTNLFQRGYVVPAPFDFTITTDKSNKKSFRWDCSLGNLISLATHREPPIGSHPPQQLAEFMPFREDTLEEIVKIQTFWRFTNTDDFVFLQIPYPYSDHNYFTAMHGVFDSREAYSMNIQLWWHHLDGTVLIKAGTPLCQLIPIPREYNIDLVVEEAGEDDFRKNKKSQYLLAHQYNKKLSTWKTHARKLYEWKN